jgi:hypothetical protein
MSSSQLVLGRFVMKERLDSAGNGSSTVKGVRTVEDDLTQSKSQHFVVSFKKRIPPIRSGDCNVP